jgi:hypothetical protein
MLSVPASSRSLQTRGRIRASGARESNIPVHTTERWKVEASLRVPSIIFDGEERIQLALVLQI